MNKKQYGIYAAVFVVLAALEYLQFRTWQHFDWNTFLSQTSHVSKLRVVFGIGWIYLAYILRAIRWNIFLRPARRVRGPAGCTDDRGIYRPGIARSSRRNDSPLPDRAQRKSKLFFPNGGLGRRTHFSPWRVCASPLTGARL